MTLAYASDGIIGGGATFLAGLLLQFLDAHTPMLGGVRVDSYDTLFVICAVVVTTSALAFASLKESGATGVRAFFANFGSGSAIRALLAIPSYGALTSEDRRKELAKLASKYAEAARIAIRNVRRDGMEALKADENKKLISEDERKRHETEVQKLTDEQIKAADEAAAAKEKEILGK